MTGKEKFKEKLSNLSRKELFEHCKKYIWLAAFAANNPHSDYHWMVDLCYDECYKRKATKIYSDAYRITYVEQFGSDPHPEYGKIGDYNGN